MNSNVMPSRVQMEKEVLNRLVKQVQETVAVEFNSEASKNNSLRAIDFWGVRKNRRAASSFLRRGPIRVF
jgi:hypothetical protein